MPWGGPGESQVHVIYEQCAISTFPRVSDPYITQIPKHDLLIYSSISIKIKRGTGIQSGIQPLRPSQLRWEVNYFGGKWEGLRIHLYKVPAP